MGQRYRRMEDQKSGPGLASNLDFAKGGRLEPKLKGFLKLSKLGDEVSKLVQTKRVTESGLEAAAGRFFEVKKRSYFNAI